MKKIIIIPVLLCLLLSCKTQKNLGRTSGGLQIFSSVERPQKFTEISADDATFLINAGINGKVKFTAYPKLNELFIQVGNQTPVACSFDSNFECSLGVNNSLEFVKIYTGNIIIRQIYPPDELDEATLFEEPEKIAVKRLDSFGKQIQYLVFVSDELYKQIRCKKENAVITLCFYAVKGKKIFYRIDLSDFEHFNVIHMELDISSMHPSFIYGK